jgi:hypothetical protein
MVINKKIIKKIEENYIKGFSNELEKYLLVKYSEEPFPYVFSEQDLYANIEKDIRDYYAGNIDVTIKSPSERWLIEREYLQNLYIDKCHEIRELEDYIEELENVLLEPNLKPYRMKKHGIDF